MLKAEGKESAVVVGGWELPIRFPAGVSKTQRHVRRQSRLGDASGRLPAAFGQQELLRQLPGRELRGMVEQRSTRWGVGDNLTL